MSWRSILEYDSTFNVIIIELLSKKQIKKALIIEVYDSQIKNFLIADGSCLIMFAFNAWGLPINKEVGMLSIDISNSKELSYL